MGFTNWVIGIFDNIVGKLKEQYSELLEVSSVQL